MIGFGIIPSLRTDTGYMFQLVDQCASVYDANYVPFGSVHGESGSDEFKYTGKHFTPSELLRYRVRYSHTIIG